MEYNAKNAPEDKGIELKTIMHYVNRILQK